METERLQKLLNDGLEKEIFPCYASAVGCGNEVWFESFGGRSAICPAERAMTKDTLFDMASLSKLMGTTMAALKLIEQGRLKLDNKISDYFENCHGKGDITIFQLLTHTSGIKAHFPLWKRGILPNDAAEEILREPFGYASGTNAVYTCMGFILLGRILEKMENEPLDKIVKRLVFEPLGMKNSFYCPPAGYGCAATERDNESGEIICGTVHDENARFLGGVSGNAGIFSTLGDCIKFATMLSNRGNRFLSKEIFENAVADHTPDFDEHRGLGFQLVGKRYGHNGFTGTSIYVDGTNGKYAILLTNRVHPTRDNHKLFGFRREFHQMIFGE